MNSEQSKKATVPVVKYIPPENDDIRQYSAFICSQIAKQLDIQEFAADEVICGLTDCLILMGQIIASSKVSPNLN